MIPKLTS